MLDAFARKLIDPPLNTTGRALARAGVRANGVTLAGLFFGLGAASAIVMGAFPWAIVLILLSRLADGLDGAVARATQKSDFGGYFDIVCDFFFYGAVPFSFILLDPESNAIAGAFLLLSFYVNGASFLGYAIVAQKNNMETRAQGIKSLYYSNGLLEGTETIGFFVLLCVAPNHFTVLSLTFGGLCFNTAILRVWGAFQLFSSTPRSDPSDV